MIFKILKKYMLKMSWIPFCHLPLNKKEVETSCPFILWICQAEATFILLLMPAILIQP